MEERIGNPELSHELVNDVPVLMQKLEERMGVGRALDEIVSRHGNRQWWSNGLAKTLSILLRQEIWGTDFGDGRLSEVVRVLSNDEVWHELERKVTGNMIRAYKLKVESSMVNIVT